MPSAPSPRPCANPTSCARACSGNCARSNVPARVATSRDAMRIRLVGCPPIEAWRSCGLRRSTGCHHESKLPFRSRRPISPAVRLRRRIPDGRRIGRSPTPRRPGQAPGRTGPRLPRGAPLTDEPSKPPSNQPPSRSPDEKPASPPTVQAVLDPLCIAGVQINPESRVKVAIGTGQTPPRGGRLDRFPRQGPQRGRGDRPAAAPHEPQCQERPAQLPEGGVSRDRWLGTSPCSMPSRSHAPSADSPSSTASSQLYSRDRGQARRPSSPSTSGRARRTSASATRSTSSSPARPCPQGPAPRLLDENGKPTTAAFEDPRQASVASIPPRPSAPPPTSPFIRRSTAPTANPSPSSRPAAYTTKRTYRGPESILAGSQHRHRRRQTPEGDLEVRRSTAGSTLPCAAGGPAIITSMPPAAPTTPSRARVCTRPT